MLERVGAYSVMLEPGAPFDSQWSETDGGLTIRVALRDPHDTALELLLCLGQALWARLTVDESRAFWRLLDAEIRQGVPGEIDEDALAEKRALLAAPRSRRALERYAQAAFAGTAAEYVHALWHDVAVRTGPDYLPAAQLRRRIEVLARWFPPGPGHALIWDRYGDSRR